MLAIVIALGISLIVLFISIMIFLVLGKYDSNNNELVRTENPEGLSVHKSATFNYWEAIHRSKKGEVQYISVVLLFIVIHLFFFALITYLLQEEGSDNITRLVFYGLLLLLPFSYIRGVWKAYKKHKEI